MITISIWTEFIVYHHQVPPTKVTDPGFKIRGMYATICEYARFMGPLILMVLRGNKTC